MSEPRSNHFVSGAVEGRRTAYDFFATSEHKPQPEGPVGQGKARAQEAEWGGHRNGTAAAAAYLARGGRF